MKEAALFYENSTMPHKNQLIDAKKIYKKTSNPEN